MFTGLVQDVGTVRAIEDIGADRRITIETGMDLKTVSVGASIACSGCCLTAIEIIENAFIADVSIESLSKTIIEQWDVGMRVNIEPSLRLGDEMGGHIVSGHVDGLAVLDSLEEDGESFRLKLSVPDELARYIAPKGSVTLDGISLTVNDVDGNVFGVNIIPHTWSSTTLHLRQAGDTLNLEIDMLARYVARQLEQRSAA